MSLGEVILRNGVGQPIEVRIQQVGIVGPAGKDALGANASYLHTQSVASTTWNVNHGLQGYPNVSTFQLISVNTWEQIEGDVTYVDTNTITIQFGVAVSGRAILS